MRKKIVAFVFVGIVVIILPLTLLLLKKSQDTRSRASTETVSFFFTPSTQNVIMGNEFSVVLSMNTNNIPIEAIDFTLTFSKDTIELLSSSQVDASIPNVLTQLPNNTTGTFRYVGVAKNNTAVSGSSIAITTLRFKAKAAGSASVGFSAPAEVASTNATTSLISTVTNATYTVLSESACTPTTNRPDGCTCQLPSECHSNTCTDGTCVIAATVAPTSTAPTPTSIPIQSEPTITHAPTSAPIPTSTVFPTPTVGANDTYLKFGIRLNSAGIGIGTDGLNNSPQRPQRIAKIEIYNEQNVLIKTIDGVFTYSTTDGAYWGLGNLGSTFPSGKYLLKVKFDNTLKKLLPGIITINNGENNYGINTALVTGDLNNDNELNLADYTMMLACIAKEAGCTQ